MVHLTSIFFDSILTKNIYSILRGNQCPERRMIEFWISFPLRNTLSGVYNGNSKPKAVLGTPQYFETPIGDLKKLKEDGLINGAEEKISHKLIYNSKIDKIQVNGKLVARIPGINWALIWPRIKGLSPQLKETMFLFNHDILPSREKMKKQDKRLNLACSDCGATVETTIHVLLHCPERKEIASWLQLKLKELGNEGNMEDLLRMELKKNKFEQEAIKLVASYVFVVWSRRKEKRKPKQEEVIKKLHFENRKCAEGRKEEDQLSKKESNEFHGPKNLKRK